MPDPALHILMDQNIPVAAADWLRAQRLEWTVHHVNELGFAGRDDSFLFLWAQRQAAIVITYDEDFADARYYPLGSHRGVVRRGCGPRRSKPPSQRWRVFLSSCRPRNGKTA